MEVVNTSTCDVQATQAVDKHGRPWLVVIAKASYALPADALQGQRPLRALPKDQATPLLLSDQFVGEPGLSAPLAESDLAPFKNACDVIVKGSAHAPWQAGQPTEVQHLDVGLSVHDASGQQALLGKALRVHGPRQWRHRLAGWDISAAQGFVEQPVHHGIAFGGTHALDSLGRPLRPKEAAMHAHPMNLVGLGHGRGPFARLMDGQGAPQTELWRDGKLQPVTEPGALLEPAAFGPIARNWQPRLPLAGTYDEAWKEEVFPLLPQDFDERFYQCAPLDQQMPYPQGGEWVTLVHLTQAAARQAPDSQGRYCFRLPKRRMPMRVLMRNYDSVEMKPQIDTVFIDTDAHPDTGAMRLDLVWRARSRLRRSLQEVHSVVVGPTSRRWWQARLAGESGCAACGGERTKPDNAAAAAASAEIAAPQEPHEESSA